jgi:hypothetical protein
MIATRMDKEPHAYLLPSSGKTICLPNGYTLNACRYNRTDDDLILTFNGSGPIILRHFYAVEKAPYLRDSSGDFLSGDLARLLAGLSVHAVHALMRHSLRRGNQAG